MKYNYKTAGSMLAALLAMAVPQTRAQTAEPAEALEEDDEAIVLSPFIISAEEDVGSYQATSTLAGTRLRTDLKDVGSAVSVVTEQFIKDTGATSNEDLLVYTTGTEVGGIQGNFTGAGNGRQLGEGNQLMRPNSNTRVRGLTAADNTRDFFLTEIPWDGYNTGRVDIQRGPNAILFGMGSPAGIINSSIDQASFRNENEVELRYDNEGSVRGSMNLNRVLIKNELAVRLAALTDRQNFRQEPAFNRDDRIYGALRYDPAFLKKNGMETSFRINYEDGSIKSNRPRSLTPADQISAWFTELNKATYNPRAAWAVDGTGVTSERLDDGTPNPNYNPWVGAYGNIYGNVVAFFPNGSSQQSAFRTLEITRGGWGLAPDGTVDSGIGGEPFARMVGLTTFSDYMTRTGAPYASLNAYKDQRLGDDDVGLFNFYDNLLDGDNKREWRGFESMNVALSQTFFNNRVGIEAVYDKQKYNDGQLNGVNQTLYVDINTHYLDGSPNPFVGQAFVQSDNGGTDYRSESEAKRVTAFADFRSEDLLGRSTLTRILGRHVVTGMYAEEEKKQTSREFERFAMPLDYVTEAAGPNQFYDLDSNEREVLFVSYLSNNLGSLGNANQAGLHRVPNGLVPQNVNSVYRYNTRWSRPTDPTAPGYVDPAAAWTPPAGREGDTQADNPENYYGWGNYPVSGIWNYDGADKDRLYKRGVRGYRDVRSQAFVWQSYLLDETLVPTIGWRKDEYVGGNSLSTDIEQLNGTKEWEYNDDGEDTGESLSYSIVAHTPRFIRQKLPFGSNFSVFFNKSENFQPSPGQVDMFGENLANPMGETKDYGFVISVLDDRLSLKVNWYETNVTNARLQGFEFWRVAQWSTILMQNAVRVRDKDPANTWKWDASNTNGGATQAEFDAGSAAVFDAYANNETFKKFVDGWGFTQHLVTERDSTANTPPGIAATSDTDSKGIEFELAAKPTPNWNIAFNVAKTKASQNNIGGALKEWIEEVETLAMGPAGDLRVWWAGDSTNMRTFYQQNVGSQYNLLKLLEGSDVPELRRWRANLVTGYNFDHGFLKGVNIGAAYRWEDRVVLGFPIKSQANPTTGATEYVYDVSNPYRGPTENHVDFWIGYGRKLTSRIDWRIQLNVRDVFAEKKLIPISVQPDGTPAAYRIPELTTWQLTNTFSF